MINYCCPSHNIVGQQQTACCWPTVHYRVTY